MIGGPGINVLAYASASGYWEPYLLYPTGPYPGRAGPPKDFEFLLICGPHLFHKPVGRKVFLSWEKSYGQT